MRYIPFIVFVFFIAACKPKTPEFKAPSSKEINDVAEALLFVICRIESGSASLDVIRTKDRKVMFDTCRMRNEIDSLRSCAKKGKIRFSSFNLISEDLEKTEVMPADTGRCSVLGARRSEFSLKDLMRFSFGDKSFFSSKDSLYILFQNKILPAFKFNTKMLEREYITNIAEIKKREKEREERSFWSISMPVFSLDGKRAYIELTNNCYELCGSGTSYFLEKQNNKWVIINWVPVWIG